MSDDGLRVGVPAELLSLTSRGGHGKVWNRVLGELRRSARIVALDPRGRPRGRWRLRPPTVVLASGHEDIPPVRVPVVTQVHEAAWFDPGLRAVLNPEFYEYISVRTERAVRASTGVIVPSQAARRDVVAAYGLDPAAVHAVHHGLDSWFSPEAEGGRALVARARGGRDAPYVLHAAMLHPRKNLPVLREAMSRLAAEGFPHLLVIVGDPAADRADSAELARAAAAELPGAPDRVVHLGRPDDRALAALMAGADAFCLPSLYEGFGLTALEAMACGAPVVVSDRGALPEVVGDAGLVVEPTPTAVEEALRTLLTDRALATRLAHAGVARARTFTWARTASGWLEVLRAAAPQP